MFLGEIIMKNLNDKLNHYKNTKGNIMEGNRNYKKTNEYKELNFIYIM